MNLKPSPDPGTKFGRLTIRKIITTGKTKKAECCCDCGKIKNVNYYNLVNGTTISCGCARKEISYRNQY